MGHSSPPPSEHIKEAEDEWEFVTPKTSMIPPYEQFGGPRGDVASAMRLIVGRSEYPFPIRMISELQTFAVSKHFIGTASRGSSYGREPFNPDPKVSMKGTTLLK
jgi:hypothetical protein